MTSRNTPCPCGSGRKFKNCCLPRATIGPALEYGPRERQAAVDRLAAFAARPEFSEVLEAAEEVFWAGLLDEVSEQRRRELLGDANSRDAFWLWALFDMDQRENEADEETIAGEFLARHGASLPEGERLYLERMLGTSLRLYEVGAVRRDEGLTLTDLWSGRTLEVSERLATSQLVQWDVLAARVTGGPGGRNVLEGPGHVYPRHAADEMMRQLRHNQKLAARKEAVLADPTRFLKRFGFLFHQYWVHYTSPAALPEIVTSDGDALSVTRVRFDIADPDRAAQLLAAHADLERHADGTFVFLGRGDAARRVLGTIRIDGPRLTVEAMSERRAAAARSLVESLLGDLATVRASVSENIAHSLRQAPAEKRRFAVPAVEQEAAAQFLTQHYRSWIDEKIPALGNRTPRHAACLKTIRPRLIELLKQIENGLAQQARSGGPGVDVSWLWSELHLTRPG